MLKIVKMLTLMLALGLSTAFAAVPVNVNTADAKTMAQNIKGIGLKKANAIIQYREKHGPFKKVDDLIRVKGIGLKLVDQNRDIILVSDQSLKKK